MSTYPLSPPTSVLLVSIGCRLVNLGLNATIMRRGVLEEGNDGGSSAYLYSSATEFSSWFDLLEAREARIDL